MPARAPLRRVLAGMAVAALAATGCSSPAPTDAGTDGQGWTIAAAFYPLQYVAEAVGGDLVTVTNLTKPGAEPHDLELAPQDLAQLTDADLAVYLTASNRPSTMPSRRRPTGACLMSARPPTFR